MKNLGKNVTFIKDLRVKSWRARTQQYNQNERNNFFATPDEFC